MYDILLVDDEPAARKSLEYLLDYEKHGFQVAEEASNGAEAIELMAGQSFQLIITDIRMPVMDGLKFAAQVRESRDVPIIIVSGYEDFEYARQALKVGVVDYLLKPVGAEELAAKLSEIKQKIEDKMLTEQRLYHALPIMREQWLRHWAHGVLEDPSFLGRLELSTQQENFSSFCLMLIELESRPKAYYEQQDQDLKIRRFAVKNVVEEVCGKQGELFEESDMRYGLIWMGDEAALNQDRMLQRATMIIEATGRYARESVTIAIGPIVVGFQNLVQSYLSSLKVLDGKTSSTEGPILIGTRLDWKQEPQVKLTVERVKEIARKQFQHNLNLRQIAGQIYMNPTYLGQLFKMHEGISFQQYLLKLRMDKAKELLLNTDRKVYEIAAEVGYRELDWFYKKFREYEGKSPTEFRGESD
jgi:two-component system response regulator YesN